MGTNLLVSVCYLENLNLHFLQKDKLLAEECQIVRHPWWNDSQSNFLQKPTNFYNIF